METNGKWNFGGTWPYQPRWFESEDGQMHYVDEGPRDGRPVVLVHGNPTWAYLRRNFIPPLTAAGYRVIVPDHLVLCHAYNDGFRAAQMLQDKAQFAVNGCSIDQDCNAVLWHLGSSLRAGREAVVRGVAPLGKDAPLPARCA